MRGNFVFSEVLSENKVRISFEDITLTSKLIDGTFPDYENKQNIDGIEREMNASGYTCERIK